MFPAASAPRSRRWSLSAEGSEPAALGREWDYSAPVCFRTELIKVLRNVNDQAPHDFYVWSRVKKKKSSVCSVAGGVSSDWCGHLKLRGELQSSRKNVCRSVLKILSQFSDIKHLSAVAFETTEVCMCVCLTSEAPTELRLPRCELEAVSGLTQSYLGVCSQHVAEFLVLILS